MASIATVIPWLFFFVAALVSLTSMTRMVQEERVLMWMLPYVVVDAANGTVS